MTRPVLWETRRPLRLPHGPLPSPAAGSDPPERRGWEGYRSAAVAAARALAGRRPSPKEPVARRRHRSLLVQPAPRKEGTPPPCLRHRHRRRPRRRRHRLPTVIPAGKPGRPHPPRRRPQARCHVAAETDHRAKAVDLRFPRAGRSTDTPEPPLSRSLPSPLLLAARAGCPSARVGPGTRSAALERHRRRGRRRRLSRCFSLRRRRRHRFRAPRLTSQTFTHREERRVEQGEPEVTFLGGVHQ